MRIGYVGITPYRKGKKDKDEGKQEALLKSCDEIIKEKAWTSSENNMNLPRIISSLQSNDELVICSLKFLAQDSDLLIKRIQAIESTKATLTVLDMENTLSSHFIAFKSFTSYVSSAKIISGKIKSRKVQGRPKKLDVEANKAILKQWQSGHHTISHLARTWKVSRRSINRIINESEK